MLDTKAMTVQDVRKILVVKYGLSQEEANSLTPKSVAVAKLMEFEGDEELLDNVVVEEDNVDVQEFQEPETLTPDDEGWTDYVLSQLRPNELMDKYPKLEGLRRMVEKVLGPIETCTSKVLQTPSVDNNFHATVRVRVTVGGLVMDGCADSSSKNTPHPFSLHPTSTAESKAEARCYRRLLKLSNVVAAEEIVKEDEIMDMGEKIQDTQLLSLDKFCEKGNIDVEKFLNKEKIDVLNITNVSRSKAMDLLSRLNGMMFSQNLVPDDIKGYNKNWRKV